MTDDEYKVHMTMWAAMKSPLIIGTDVTALDAKAYSIYTNPAILALSQDPAGSAITRKWRYYTSPGDYYGVSEIQMHSGNLANGDYVVVLLNAATHEMHMNATAADIFVDQGGRIGAEAKSQWDVYDLWANRMPDHVANQVLKSNSTVGISALNKYYYNATKMSYADGIAANQTLLMGTKVSWIFPQLQLSSTDCDQVGTLAAQGTLKAMVPSHGVMAYRLRPAGSPITHDEL